MAYPNLDEPEPKYIDFKKMEYWNNGILKKQYSNIPGENF
jgi:hypothetical protein